MRFHLILSTRPNYIKIAPLLGAFFEYLQEVKVDIIHTGQHFDTNLSEIFESDLNIPKPIINFGISGGTNQSQLEAVEEAYSKYLKNRARPNLVIVVGDVNATLAASRAANRFNIPIAHIEAGLRSFDESMPEEFNRIETDKLSNYLFASEPSALSNLEQEGVNMDFVYLVGNIMLDTLVLNKQKAEYHTVLHDIGIDDKPYILFSAHRPSNVDKKDDLINIIDRVKTCLKYVPVVFPIHPRTKKQLIEFNLWDSLISLNGLYVLDPLGYHAFLKLQMCATIIITDSGGVQEESSFLNIPCLTLRANTERPITVDQGTNLLVGQKDVTFFEKQIENILAGHWKQSNLTSYWDGQTAFRIIQIFKEKIIPACKKYS